MEIQILSKEDYSSFEILYREVFSMYTEKIRLYPNKTQQKKIDDILYHCRKLYNYLLELDIETYKTSKKSILGNNLYKIAKDFIGKKIPGKVTQQVCRRLNLAFERFFKHLGRFPKFKSESKYLSFGVTGVGRDGTRIHPGKSKIQFVRIGNIKAIFTRPILGVPKSMVIKRMKSGKYYAFVFIDDCDIPKTNIQNRKEIVGIDLGVSKFITTNNGDIVKSSRFLKKNLDKLRRAHRELSRKQKGSHNWEKARVKVARIYEKVANCRRDFQFKVAHAFVVNYNHIVCEDLRISEMVKNKPKSMRRAIMDQGFYGFLVILEHLCNKYSCAFTKVDPHYTTQDCSRCGTRVKKDLSTRIHKCPHCGLEIDRDVNAAINILHRGQQQLAVALAAANFPGTGIVSSNIYKFVEGVITGLKTGSEV